jgi:membrane-associated phospholipid phosphatase
MQGIGAWKAADLLTAVFLVGLVLLVLGSWKRLKQPARLLLAYLVLLALQATISVGRTGGLPPLIPAFFPTVPVLGIYATLGFIPEINPRDRDPVLSRLDRALFGVEPSLWMERFARPALTEVMQLAYLAYYILPFVLLGTLYQRGDEPAFDRCMGALVLSHYLAFLGYLTVPALGPRFLLAGRYRAELPGLLLAGPVRNVLDALEGIKRDAFPSGHTSAILVTVYYALRSTPELSPWFIPAAGLMILSTIYLRYHYVVDVLAGALLAALCVLLAAWLQ